MLKSEVTLLKEENNNQALNLRVDDWEIIKKIMKSMSIFRVNSYDREVIQRDLIGMAHEAKLRDSSLQEVIGDDVKGFATEIINSSSGPCKREILIKFLERLSGFFLFFYAIIAIGGYGSLSSWHVNPVALYLFYTGWVVIAFATEEIITPLFITEKGIKKYLSWLITIPLILGLSAAMQFLGDNQYIREVTIGPEVIPTVVISGLVFLATKYFNVKNINRLAKDKKNYIQDLK